MDEDDAIGCIIVVLIIGIIVSLVLILSSSGEETEEPVEVAQIVTESVKVAGIPLPKVGMEKNEVGSPQAQRVYEEVEVKEWVVTVLDHTRKEHDRYNRAEISVPLDDTDMEEVVDRLWKKLKDEKIPLEKVKEIYKDGYYYIILWHKEK